MCSVDRPLIPSCRQEGMCVYALFLFDRGLFLGLKLEVLNVLVGPASLNVLKVCSYILLNLYYFYSVCVMVDGLSGVHFAL